jgi:hypothetical protein
MPERCGVPHALNCKGLRWQTVPNRFIDPKGELIALANRMPSF